MVFFSRAICTLASGGSEARKAWGRIDLAHHAGERQPDRAGGLGLAERHGVDARAQRLADEGGRVDGQADDAGGEQVVQPHVADGDVDEVEREADLGSGEAEEDEHDQQRRVADRA